MHELTNLELDSFAAPAVVCVRLASQSGKSLVLPCEVVAENRVAPSNGTNGLDRVRILVAGDEHWVERRDLCDEDGESIAWEPYELGQTG